jgi:inosine-uridine nucleoside N-ribohydrolase
MNIILETDLLGDPDDFFAFCYLASANVNIKGIVVTPGHTKQVQMMRTICAQLGWDVPIGGSYSKLKNYSDYTGFWQNIADRYNSDQYSGEYDCDGYKVIEKCYNEDPDITFVIIGPPANTGEFLRRNPNVKIKKLLMQGGFIGYESHNDSNVVRLPKFEGKTVVRSFNPGNAPEAMVQLLSSNIEEKYFVSKNVCHTVIMNYEKFLDIKKCWANQNPTPASDLYINGLLEYNILKNEKRFHDPTACVCLLHPEIAKWVDGTLYSKKKKGKYYWGFNVTDTICNSQTERIITSIDYDKLWDCLTTLT